MTDQTTKNPLNSFADDWEIDGDVIECRNCSRRQAVSWAHHNFPHRVDCPAANVLRQPNPWKTLASLINAQISRAKEPV